jgi:hypothetical protein
MSGRNKKNKKKNAKTDNAPNMEQLLFDKLAQLELENPNISKEDDIRNQEGINKLQQEIKQINSSESLSTEEKTNQFYQQLKDHVFHIY